MNARSEFVCMFHGRARGGGGGGLGVYDGGVWA